MLLGFGTQIPQYRMLRICYYAKSFPCDYKNAFRAGEPRPYVVTLGHIVGYFKYQSTKMINLHGQKLWQRNYYEHIIQDEKAYHNISNYILNNPAQWAYDRLR